MLSTPFCSHIIHYDPPRRFLVPKFSTYDGFSDPFDHIMHYRQLMTLDIGNDALLCKVFPTSLQGHALSWFHRLPPNSVDNFRDLSEAFVGQYLCSARHKQNISTLQNIKMQENESLREFVKRFGQAVLQVEAYSMDAVLQIFKRSICPGTPFFESLAKKPPTTMNDLFRHASKYSMLEDDVRATTQQILVAEQTSRSGAERSAKPPDRPRSFSRRQEEQSRLELPPLTPLSISYEKLLPMIQNMFDFRWPGPLRADPSKRDHSKKCAYHKEHGHTTETCKSLHYLVEKLIRAGHLKQYLRSDARVRDTSRNHNSGTSRIPAAPKAVINYIHRRPLDEEYDSKRKRQRLLRAASVRERVNSIRPGIASGGPRPIDGTIIFPPIDPKRILQPHRDALILSLEMGDFDVRRILVDPGSSADLLQASVISHMGRNLTGLENPSFLTEDRQIDLYGSQLAARQCYQIAREVGTSQEDKPFPESTHALDQ
uniref:Retrotransposon gag domain-containing protein n=1 Tax=Vitis vinifera TaxID=29760 RepID=A5BHY8_VITVI|nr:hypothetical protein VITISV_002484 [Vitis vinifera]